MENESVENLGSVEWKIEKTGIFSMQTLCQKMLKRWKMWITLRRITMAQLKMSQLDNEHN